MRTFKRAAAFLLAFLLISSGLSFSLNSISDIGIRISEYEKGQEDVVVLGHSLSREGIDPLELTQVPGQAFNMAVNTPVYTFLPILKELNGIRPVRKVYLELSYVYFFEGVYNRDSFTTDPTVSRILWKQAPLSTLQLASQLNMVDVLAPYFFYPESVRNIPNTVRLKLSQAYRMQDPAIIESAIVSQDARYRGHGFFSRNRLPGEAPSGDSGEHFSRDRLAKEPVEQFAEVVEYCRKQNIEVVAFACALPPERLRSEPFDEVHAFYEGICRELEIPLYDMNYLHWDLLPRQAEDYGDLNGHAEADLAARQGRLLGEIAAAQDPSAYFAEDYQQVLQELPRT